MKQLFNGHRAQSTRIFDTSVPSTSGSSTGGSSLLSRAGDLCKRMRRKCHGNKSRNTGKEIQKFLVLVDEQTLLKCP